MAVTDKMPALKSLIEENEKVIIETADYDGTACYFAASGISGCSWSRGLCNKRNVTAKHMHLRGSSLRDIADARRLLLGV